MLYWPCFPQEVNNSFLEQLYLWLLFPLHGICGQHFFSHQPFGCVIQLPLTSFVQMRSQLLILVRFPYTYVVFLLLYLRFFFLSLFQHFDYDISRYEFILLEGKLLGYVFYKIWEVLVIISSYILPALFSRPLYCLHSFLFLFFRQNNLYWPILKLADKAKG